MNFLYPALAFLYARVILYLLLRKITSILILRGNVFITKFLKRMMLILLLFSIIFFQTMQVFTYIPCNKRNKIYDRF